MRTRPFVGPFALSPCTNAPAALGQCYAHDAQFHALTEAGNRAFKEHDDVTASRLYGEALTEAERLFELAASGGGPSILLAPMVHNIPCHNAAEAKKRAGDDAGACSLELRAVERLVPAAESPASPLALRVNCVRHLKYALAFLAQDLTGRQPDKGTIQTFLARASLVTTEVMRIAGLVAGAASGPAPPGSDTGTCRGMPS